MPEAFFEALNVDCGENFFGKLAAGNANAVKSAMRDGHYSVA